MSKDFGENERRICNLFKKGQSFEYNGEIYEVIQDADKPTCGKGEPKTDIFIETLNKSNNQKYYFKVSYKQRNADFLENKTSAERAELILGENWMDTIEESTEVIHGQFDNAKLIYKDKYGRTNAGSITLGWKFELLRVKSGALSDKMNLSYGQKVDVYSGTNLPKEKRDSIVNGCMVKDSGVADYVFEEKNTASCVSEAVAQFKTIPEYLNEYPDIYYACKALNYRTFENKYDGNRPLAVHVDWFVKDNKLAHEIIYERPLVTGGREVAERLLEALRQLNVNTTDDLTEDNVLDYKKIVYERE